MRFLVLAQRDDVSALRVVEALRRRYAPAQVALVHAHELALGKWSHQVDTDGTDTIVKLRDGRVLADGEIGAVFNRLGAVTLPHYERAATTDRDYAHFEFQALVLSWLEGFGERVVNPPVPPSLAGPQLTQCEMLLMAGRAGLPTRSIHAATSARAAPAPTGFDALGLDWSQPGCPPQWQPRLRSTLGQSPIFAMETMRGEPRQLLVAGQRVVGSMNAQMAAGCHRLGGELRCPLLRVTVDRAMSADSEWRVTAVSPLPFFDRPDEIDAVLALLEARASGRE